MMIYVLVGLLAGIISGALGVGGGTLMVPVFVLFFGLSQHQAQGTALAVMLPPVFFFAAWRYYIAGNVEVKIALWVALGLVAGAFLGAHLAQKIPMLILRRLFGIFLVMVGIKMVFLK